MTTVKLLRVEGPAFLAGSVWTQDAQGYWRCRDASKALKWMIGLSSAYTVKTWLDARAKEGWKITWTSLHRP